ncbi:MAG: hypothetical protein JW807_10685 [Spirochaetes bacterium]|nr:hypothetical protein [Spirochaetota bacterium]
MKKSVAPAILAAAVICLFCGRDNTGSCCAGVAPANEGARALTVCIAAAESELEAEGSNADRTGYAGPAREIKPERVDPATGDSGGTRYSSGRNAPSGSAAARTPEASTAKKSGRASKSVTAASDSDASRKTAADTGPSAERSPDKTSGVNGAGAKETAGGMAASEARDNKQGAPATRKEENVSEDNEDSMAGTREKYAAPEGLLAKPRVDPPEVK